MATSHPHGEVGGLIDLRTAARMAGVPERRLRRWLDLGHVPAALVFRPGRRVYVRVALFRRWLWTGMSLDGDAQPEG